MPPALKQLDPFLVLEKIELQLDLLATGDTALKTVRAVQNALDQPLITMIERQLEFTIDNKMREIGAEPHFRHRINQAERRIEVVGDAVAVGFKLDRHANLVGHVNPAADHRNHTINRKRHHLADDIDKGSAKILCHDQRFTQ